MVVITSYHKLIQLIETYMIVMNIDVSDGLVNGAIGTLNNDKIGRKVKSKYIEFMKENKIPVSYVPIVKETVIMTSSAIKVLHMPTHEAFRYQFPLKPAEAMTIHKSQGSTMKQVCLDLKW